MSDREVWDILSDEDNKELAVPCWGNFDSDGELECLCHGNCQEEYLCEIIATVILAADFDTRLWDAIQQYGPQTLRRLAEFYQMLEWSVRFRYALYIVERRDYERAGLLWRRDILGK